MEGVEVNEPVDARLSDEDLGRVRAALAATGKKPGRLQLRASHEVGTKSDAGVVYAFFAPDVLTSKFRRGPLALVVKLPASPAKNAPLAWTVVKNRFVYVQVATGTWDAANESPIPVMEAVVKDEDLVSIVSWAGGRRSGGPDGRAPRLSGGRACSGHRRSDHR